MNNPKRIGPLFFMADDILKEHRVYAPAAKLFQCAEIPQVTVSYRKYHFMIKLTDECGAGGHPAKFSRTVIHKGYECKVIIRHALTNFLWRDAGHRGKHIHII